MDANSSMLTSASFEMILKQLSLLVWESLHMKNANLIDEGKCERWKVSSNNIFSLSKIYLIVSDL